MPDAAASAPSADYASRAWTDLRPLAEHGDDPQLLVGRVRRMLTGEEPPDARLLDWLRRDVPESTEDPDELYTRIASGGLGESVFRHGAPALSAAGYGARTDAVSAWSVQRFAGLGCPWILGPAEHGATVVDLGCGSGVDVATAAQPAGSDVAAIGVDIRAVALPPADGAPDGASFLVAATDATGLPHGCATLALANGLPPLLATDTAPAVLREVVRILRPGGELRAVVLVTGPDRDAKDLDALTVLNAVRCGKPICARVRAIVADAGLVDVRMTGLPSPFIDGFRPGPVATMLLSASKP